MQRSDRWPEDYDPSSTTSSSRRNSASSRRNSLKKEKEKKKSPRNSSVSSANSTPKRVARAPQSIDLVVTGKQLLKKADRANSLPGGNQRRPSLDSTKRRQDVKRTSTSQGVEKSRDTSLEDEVSLDLSQVSDFEETSSKYGLTQKLTALATSTPKPRLGQKPRSASMNQSGSRIERLKSDSSKSRDSTFSNSRDSLYKTSSASNSTLRYGASTELDYSSVSPEYSGQSSADLSPRLSNSDRSQELHVSSCCISTCNDCTEAERTKVPELAEGEWSRFWQHYNLGLTGPRRYYDQCPTPYRNDTFDVADLDLSTESTKRRSPEDIKNINSIIRNEGLHLTPRETQNIIKCAHILGNVLTKAIERRSKEKDEYPNKIEEIQLEKPENIDPESEIKKKSFTLDLKEPNVPLEVKIEKTCETVTTQTDISLPNTKSAPRIFESILRQLSRTTIEEKVEKQSVDKTDDAKKETVDDKPEEKKEEIADGKPVENEAKT